MMIGMNANATLEGERGPPPYFAGRGDELSAMRQRLDGVMGNPGSAINGLLLITGVPGIGKTHLTEHFARQATTNPNVKALMLGTSDLASPEGLLILIGRAMGCEDEFIRKAGADDKVSGARLLSAGFTLDTHRPHLMFSHMLRATRGLSIWKNKALVLVVDEVQNMRAESADQLQALHEGRHGCPIFTVAAGLQQSKTVLSRHGISRMSHRRLGLLTHDETMAAIYHGLANIGVAVAEDTADKLATAAMRFPQHVHGYLEAALKVHRECNDIDTRNAVAKVLAIGREAREEHYMSRMAAVGRADKVYPLAEYMANTEKKSVTWEKAESLIGSDVVEAAVHHGVLSVSEDGVLSFGIPSFRSYMIHRAARYRALARDEQDDS